MTLVVMPDYPLPGALRTHTNRADTGRHPRGVRHRRGSRLQRHLSTLIHYFEPRVPRDNGRNPV